VVSIPATTVDVPGLIQGEHSLKVETWDPMKLFIQKDHS
jgi:hypothetical protein